MNAFKHVLQITYKSRTLFWRLYKDLLTYILYYNYLTHDKELRRIVGFQLYTKLFNSEKNHLISKIFFITFINKC